MALLVQIRWEEPPELAPSTKYSTRPSTCPRASVTHGFDIEMEAGSSADLREALVAGAPDGSARTIGRGARYVPFGVLVAASAGALAICAVMAPAQVRGVGNRVGLSLGLYGSKGETALRYQGMEGQPFVYVDEAAKFKVGDGVILGMGSTREEVHRVEEVYNNTGCVRLVHGLEFSQQKGTPVMATEYTQQLQERHEEQASTLYSRFTKSMRVGVSPGDRYVKMERGCFQFEAGDVIELADRKTGQYEYNMITGISLDHSMGRLNVTTCSFSLAFLVAHHHDASAKPWPELSRMARVSVHYGDGVGKTRLMASTATVPKTDFSLLDTNNDGRVTQEEAIAGDPNFWAAELAARFPIVDENKDGFLYEAETRNFETLDSGGDSSISKAEAADDDFVTGNFVEWDEDKNGELSKQELLNAVFPPKAMALDTNMDRRVTQYEAVAGVPKYRFWAAEVAARFPILDKDKDGFLDESEATNYETLDSGGDHSISKAEAADDDYVTGNFAEWDEDKNGELSKQELLNAVIVPKAMALDANQDGRVTQYEAVAGVPKYRFWAAEVAARHASLDKDNDGFLDEVEAKKYETLDSDGDDAISKVEAANDSFVTGNFADWDEDKNVELSEQELLKVASGPDVMLLDANNDSIISRHEAVAGTSKFGFAAAEVAARHADLDKDNDGFLSEGEAESYKTLDSGGDHSISKAEAADDGYVTGNFAEWDEDKNGELSEQELLKAAGAKNMSHLDTDKDKAISQKESWVGGVKEGEWAAEVAARFLDTDKDGDLVLSEDERAAYATLDTNADGLISKKEAEKNSDVKTKFAKWDENSDDHLNEQELMKAALGEPDIVFSVRNVDYEKFVRDNKTLFELKRRLSEAVIGRDLNGVDERQVYVRLSSGAGELAEPQRLLVVPGSVPPARKRLLETPGWEQAGKSIRVDAWISGDVSQVSERKDQINEDIRALYSMPDMSPYTLRGIAGEKPVGVASVESARKRGNTNAGLNVPLILALLALAAAVCCLLCFLRPANKEKPPPRKSRWADNPPDAIVVPGGGVGKEGEMTPWVARRLSEAAKIYREVNEEKRRQMAKEGKEGERTLVVTSCEGIRHTARDPEVKRREEGDSRVGGVTNNNENNNTNNSNSNSKLECELSAAHLVSLGVAPEDIIMDELSLDTLGHGYFMRTTLSAAALARTLVVVTNRFHMPRARAVFEKIFNLGPFLQCKKEEYTLVFEEVSDESIEERALKRRSEWEKKQVDLFNSVSTSWNDLHDVHAYIFYHEGESRPAVEERTRHGSLPKSHTEMRRNNMAEQNLPRRQSPFATG